MGRGITSWYLQSIHASEAPASRCEMAERFDSRVIDSDDLLSSEKWEPILRGVVNETPRGWTLLGSLAESRRGIATGSNSFFLISSEAARRAEIADQHLRSCVGKANDVSFSVFRKADFDNLERRGSRCFLLDFEGELTPAEYRYIKSGEEQGLKNRYLLANRKPWYSMEKRPPSPIWASVFRRGEVVFVYNEAGVRSLTNFHCIFPMTRSADFAKALVVLLNSKAVRSRSMLLRRNFGGGLHKFEPRDLLGIPIPDLRYAASDEVAALAFRLDLSDAAARDGRLLEGGEEEIDHLISSISQKAGSVASDRLFETAEDEVDIDSKFSSLGTRKDIVATTPQRVVNYDE
jgi:adenine-specific DNA-methyltransferase